MPKSAPIPAATAVVERLSINDLTVIQSRAESNPLIVAEYAELMAAGVKFPPVQAVRNCRGVYVYDGSTRVQATRTNGEKYIPVELREGTEEDAYRLAAGANHDHGQRRTNADKRAAVLMLLARPAFANASNEEIARTAKVSAPLVASVRRDSQRISKRLEMRSVTRKGRRYQMQTGSIGRKALELIAGTELADDPKLVRRLATETATGQAKVARLLLKGRVGTFAQAKRKLARDAKRRTWEKTYDDAGLKNCTILVGPAEKLLPGNVAEESIDLCVADPPYGLSEDYADFDDRPEDYRPLLAAVLPLVFRALKPAGQLYLITSEPRWFETTELIRQAGFTVQRTLPWHEAFGVHNTAYFARTWRPIIHATKHPARFTFNADDPRAWIDSDRMAGGDGRCDLDGKLPGDTWGVGRVCAHCGVAHGDYQLNRVADGHPERIPDARPDGRPLVPNQIPVKLLERIVLLGSNAGETVLDPFHGSGTTAVPCVLHGRRYIGIELQPEIARKSRLWIAARVPILRNFSRKVEGLR